MKNKLICFDMDGVIFKEVNFWMELHKKFGTLELGKELTKKYLHADYDKLVEEVIEKLWKGRDATLYYQLINELQYSNGVDKTLSDVKNKGYLTAIISASCVDAAKRVQKDFGIDYIFANELIIKEGKISGDFIQPIGVGKENKAKAIVELCKNLKMPLHEVIYVGDSDTDLAAFEEVGVSIAFNSTSEILKKRATYIVDTNNLSDIIKYIP